MTDLSVIIPAYNEENKLPHYLSSMLEYLEKTRWSYEIIIVDDGSTDATEQVVRQLVQDHKHLRLIRLACNKGKGFAVKTGMMNATGSLRLFADADGATSFSEIERLRTAIVGARNRGSDIAIGSRAVPDDRVTVEGYFHRKIMGTAYNLLVNIVTCLNIKDTQCGFKLFTAEAAETLFPLQKTDGFGFDAEILYLGKKQHFKIAEIPVNWRDTRGSKVRLVRDSARMFVDVIKIRLYDLRGAYAISSSRNKQS